MEAELFSGADPSKTAIIVAQTGQSISFGELRDKACRIAAVLRGLGLTAGDHIAICIENQLQFLPVAWGAQVAGVIYTPISTRAPAPEAAYIIEDCGAQALITSAAMAPLAGDLVTAAPSLKHRYMLDGVIDGHQSLEEAVSRAECWPVEGSPAGQDMLYSSGTTGHPKGVLLDLPASSCTGPTLMVPRVSRRYGFTADTVFLSPGPLYHAAPLRVSLAALYLGGTVVIMQRFDAEEALAAIESYQVTASQWVPTMFVRMLKLPEPVRRSYDVSSMRVALHAAAPCPVGVKQAMFDWWGPILHEYYGGTEANGSTYCSPEDWLAHPGSVGQADSGVIHILGEDGEELPVGQDGLVYFDGASFEYHNDPAKTAGSRDPHGWSTLGDIGHLDADGFLYLTDRKAFTIVTGGVNVYPQEIEDLLVLHPKIMDAAVFGIPNDEYGEEVKAVVQPAAWEDATPELAEELRELCRANLARPKVPRSFDFDQELPRHANGKLYKRLLRDRYVSR